MSAQVMRRPLRVVALACLLPVWTPSVGQGQEAEVSCMEYDVSEARGSARGGTRFRVRTSSPDAGFLGLATLRSSSPEADPDGYPRVSRVYCGYPAYEAGLRVGDLIVTVNGRDARQPRVISAGRPGTVLDVRIQRAEEVLDLTMVSVRRPRIEGDSDGMSN